MADLRKITHASMRALVEGYGCYDAVAEVFNARWGGGASKGTISKKMSGQLDWTVAEIIALEDASGHHPITRLLARRLEERNNCGGGSLMAQTGAIAKESGEAIAAILAAEQSFDADECAQAVTEIDEAVAAMELARQKLVDRDGIRLNDAAVPFRGVVG